MKYRGTHPTQPIKFSFGGTDYSVSPGETVDIPECWVSYVKTRGLMLEVAKVELAVEYTVDLTSVTKRVAEAAEKILQDLTVDRANEPVESEVVAAPEPAVEVTRRGPGRPRRT